MMRNHDVLLVSEREADAALLDTCLERAVPRRFQLRIMRRTDRPNELLAMDHFAAILLAQDAGTEYFLRLAQRQHSPMPMIVLLDHVDPVAEARLRELGATDVIERCQLEGDLLLRLLMLCTELKAARTELRKLVARDTISGASSRSDFRAHLQRALARAQRHHCAVGLLVVNIDQFTLINEQFGEETGDRLIRLITQRLSSQWRHTDGVARLGGDEFAVILEDVGSKIKLEQIAADLVKALSQSIFIGEQQLVIDASLGGAVYPQDARDSDGLLGAARAAMRQTKTESGPRLPGACEQLCVNENGSTSMAAELRSAVRGGQLELYFQPRIALDSGQMVGMEALLRWNHPRDGVLLPGMFLGNCEQMGLMSNIGFQIIQQACAALKWMDRRLVSAAVVAINITFEQFLDSRFVDVVTEIVTRSRVDPSRIEFELTESAALRDPAGVRERMQQLTRLGIQFSLDDFGTALSPLSHLIELPITALKIDQQFVQDAPQNPQRRVVCCSIIEMARELGLTVIAEGVENLEQLRFLAGEGCNQVQGFYFSEGLPLEQIPQFVQGLRQNHSSIPLF